MRKAGKTRRGLRVVRVGVASALLLVILAFVVWWRLPDLLNLAVNRYLSGLGLEEARIHVTQAGRGDLVLEAVAAAPGLKVELGELRTRFTWRGLWADRRAESLAFDRLRIEVDWPTLQREGLPLIPQNDEPFDPFDLSWVALLPAESITVRHVEVTVQDGAFRAVLKGSATLTASSAGAVALRAELAYETLRMNLAGELSMDQSTVLRLEAHAADPLGILEQTLPDWRTRFAWADSLEDLDVGAVSIESELVAFPDRRVTASTSLRLESFDAGAEVGAVRAAGILLEVETDLSEAVGVTLSWERIEATAQELQVGPQAGSLAVRTHDLRTWNLARMSPLRVAYGAEVAAAELSASGSVTLDEHYQPTAYAFLATADAGHMLDHQLAPWKLGLRGDLQAAVIETTPLRFADDTGPRIEGLSGTVRRTGTDGWAAEWQATLVPDALRRWLPEINHTGMTLAASAGIEGDFLSVALSLESVESGQGLGGLKETLEAEGSFFLEIGAESVDLGSVWEGRGTLRGTDLFVYGPHWRAGGVGLQGTFAFTEINLAELLTPGVPTAVTVDSLAEKITLQVDWSANGLAMADTVEAHWLSGFFEYPEVVGAVPPAFRIEASAGIVQPLQESLQQVSFTLRGAGGAEAVDMKGALGFWYGGSEGELTFSHLLVDPLGAPVLEGQFVLRPLVFDYNDAVGRYQPEWFGLSFSGRLRAEGTYWLHDGEPDASAEVVFEDGAVDYPASGVSVEGLAFRLGLASAVHLSGDSEGSRLTIETLRAGDLFASDGRILFHFIDPTTVHLAGASMRLLEGTVGIDPAPIMLDPLAFDGTVRFERLSLLDLTRQMSFFDGEMEGVVSGYMPFGYHHGTLVPREGVLHLPEGEQARLRYNSRGLLSGPVDDAPSADAGLRERLSNRILETLGLQPEKVVEDALADLLISQLQIELFNEDTPLTPIRVTFSGEAVSGNTRVPLNLQTRVHGTLDELYNFIIRLNSLGSTSF